ncbi:flavodoxin, short chain [Clostridium acidisoli DSM 12555]|uniref:Flavodoxin, short chain n=1 Tax=Clostridium acidisoli DSM 12555 TaxID=1121291 RepID=A0A1W1X2K6_9CLOT|nr:flavodoxin domain-containing protein [Clostridium acidisoli]SMC18053.1 flavodoxin, short chain [Clostridium acidisoli DSM 12555]
MKKIGVIYWSNMGNVEVLADHISTGAKSLGADVEVKLVSEIKPNEITKYDAVALGSPSMDNNKIEQQEMEPFINEIRLLAPNNMPIVLFGSYGWDDGKFMVDWVQRMKDEKFDVKGSIAVKEAPTAKQLEKAEELGKLLAE